ncbi:hypothetical protein Aduo_009600 [Ancylostoma duodenale]
MSTDVGVFWTGEATDPYEALHLLGRDVVEFGLLVTSIDKSGVVAGGFCCAVFNGRRRMSSSVREASVRGGIQFRDDEASFCGVDEDEAVVCDGVLEAVIPTSNVQPLSGSYVNSGRVLKVIS